MATWTLDVESVGIDFDRPERPPAPVGLGVRFPTGKKVYYAWGHTAGGNRETAYAEAQETLARIGPNDSVLCHNAAFDLDVLETHMGFAWPARVEDTKILGFLASPDAPRGMLSLKPMAKELLGYEALPQAVLRDWVLRHVPQATPKTWGGYIYRAPASVAGPYCLDDLEMTWRLWKYLGGYRRIPAYQTELDVLPVVRDMTRAGFRTRTLDKARERTQAAYEACAEHLHACLGDIVLNSPRQLAPALMDWFGESWDDWPKTKKGNPSTSWRTLMRYYDDEILLDLRAHHQAKTILDTIARWKERLALAGDKRVHAQWNTTVGADEGGRVFGARTGRLSSNPNVQNIAKEPVFDSMANLREHVCAAPKHKLLVADYAAQEPRLLAHFAGGELAKAYREDPEIDPHQHVADMMGVPRKQAKVINLGITYGRGVAQLSLDLGVAYEDARDLLYRFKDGMRDYTQLDNALRKRWAKREPILTWAGRPYFCEAAVVDEDGEVRQSFEYKAINTLIQGSAADQMKAAMVAYHRHPDRQGELLLSVHDELVVECPTECAKAEAKVLREAMEGVGPFDVPFRADVGMGGTWNAAK